MGLYYLPPSLLLLCLPGGGGNVINKFILSGHLQENPVLKSTKTGTAMCSFILNATKVYSNAAEQKNPNLIDIISWRQTAELIGQTVKAGDLVLVEGSIYKRVYVNRLQQKVDIVEFVAEEVTLCGKDETEEEDEETIVKSSDDLTQKE